MAGRTEKITKRAVDGAKPEAKLYRLWDTELKGFGLKVLPSGVKTYILVYRPNGGGRSAPLREFTIGRHGALTPDQARREAEARLALVRLGGDPQEDRERDRAEITVADLCDLYLDEGVATKKASTLKSDGYRIRGHVKPLLGKKRVSEVTRADVERFVSDVAKGRHAVERLPTATEAKAKGLKGAKTRRRTDSAIRGGKGTSTRTAILLSAIFSFAVRRKLRPDNPCSGVAKFKPGQSQRYLSVTEAGRLGEVLSDETLSPKAVQVLRLLILTACRKSEVEALRWDEVNFSLSVLTLWDSKTGPKVVPLSAPALQVLSDVKAGYDRDLAAGLVPASPYVFPARDNPAGYFVGTPKVWREVRERAGISDVRMHDLRHTFASFAAAGGQSLLTIGKILGHASVTTTQRYAHLADDPVKAATTRTGEAIAAALAGKSGQVVELKDRTG